MESSSLTYSVQSNVVQETGLESKQPGCDFCGHTQHRVLFRGPDRLMGLPGIFSFVRCLNCGLIYQWPRLPWEQLAAYYQGDYSSYSEVVHDDPLLLRRMIRRIGVLKQRRYVEHFQYQGSLLDVGCGTGSFLAEMQLSGHWHLIGLEPTRDAAAYVRKRLGVPVVEQLFEDADLPPASQDVITLWHVLEHVVAPSYTLHKCWELLKPGGYLIFSVPNYESLGRRLFGRFWIGWDLPRHLFIFPQSVLDRMLQENGFRVIDKRCFMISYASLGHSLTFWLQSWPPRLQGLAYWLRRAYYTPVTRVALYPFQLLVERLGLATVTTWTVQKVDPHAD